MAENHGSQSSRMNEISCLSLQNSNGSLFEDVCHSDIL